MNFINQADKFRTGPEREKKKKGDEKARMCSQLCKPGLDGFPLLLM